MSGSEPRATKLTVLSTVSSAPKITIKGRWKSKPPKDGPGPGAYTPGANAKFSGTTSVSIQGRHFQRSKELGPGPGQYYQGESLSGYSSQYSFGTERRLKPRLHHQTPGPGSYGTLPLPKGPAAVLLEKGRPRALNNGPGPGTYIPTVARNLVYETSGSAVFGTSTRSAPRKMYSPGPGQYAKAVSFESTAPKYSIKSRGGDKLRSVSLTPGPGTSVGLVSSFG
mmetsp:Transcript_5727/g.14276  ORF Transcript_5727/g.14276 Transcript_5727/m.14276 type:complete len:224 (+) Transcript_5727:59-730(+)